MKIFQTLGFVGIFALSFSGTGLASMASDYHSAQTMIATTHLNDAVQKSLDPQLIPVTINTTPLASRYYSNPKTMDQAAALKTAQPASISGFVKQHALVRPHIKLTANELGDQNARAIQNNASGIVDGTYADCQKKTIKTTDFVEQTCTSETSFDVSCVNTLQVKVIKKDVPETQTVSLALHTHLNGSAKGTIQVDPSQGVVRSLSFYVYDGSNPWLCDRSYGLKVNGVLIGWYHGQCGHYLGELSFGRANVKIPFNAHTIHLDLMGGVLQGAVSGAVTYTTLVKKPVAEKHWLSSCAHLPTQCTLTKSSCLSPKATRQIDGESVHAECWQYAANYHCGGQPSTRCMALANQGCSQLQSQCLMHADHFCTREQQTWRCPQDQVIGQGLQCGEKFYCMDGRCQPTQKTKNKDFGQSAASLATLNEAGKEVKDLKLPASTKTPTVRLFGGHMAECSKDAAGVDCCAERGWGKDVLGSCTDAERYLARAKQRGVVAPAGGYCKHKTLGVCIDWRNRYCLFPNKLALDIQDQGRWAQLGISFGEKDQTNCRGLTPDELSRIHFDQINFSNVGKDIRHKLHLPDNTTIVKQNQTNIRHARDGHRPRFKKGLDDD